jgi:hypothetical protein
MLIRDIGGYLHWESKIGVVEFSLEIFWEGRIVLGLRFLFLGQACFSLKHNIQCLCNQGSPQPHSPRNERPDENRKWGTELFFA